MPPNNSEGIFYSWIQALLFKKKYVLLDFNVVYDTCLGVLTIQISPISNNSHKVKKSLGVPIKTLCSILTKQQKAEGFVMNYFKLTLRRFTEHT